MTGLVAKSRDFLQLIRFEHTLFALPYAVAGAFLAARGLPALSVCGWILVCMVGARTAAMGFNRFADRKIDALNPRTAQRQSATGSISPAFLVGAILLSVAIFGFGAWKLNSLAFYLAWPTLAVLLGYSLIKRVWHQSHLVLGIALGLSPLGAWVAVRGTLDIDALPAVFLGLAVLFWTNGFDILYACQDQEHDRSVGLHSVPAKFGTRKAFLIARLSHLLVPVLLLAVGITGGLHWAFFLGVAAVFVLLIYEHSLVQVDDLSRINQAFFTVNVVIGFLVMVATLVDVLWLGS
jgi:4-hydroxybenzoate polyprenyltransferase